MYNRLTLKKLGTKSLKAAIFLFFTLSFFLPKLSKGQGIDSTGKFVPSKSNNPYDPKIMLSPPTPKRDTVAEKETKKIYCGYWMTMEEWEDIHNYSPSEKFDDSNIRID